MVEKRYCMNCGAELKENDKFCSLCGQLVNQINQNEVTQETESVEPETEAVTQTNPVSNTEESKKESKAWIGGCLIGAVVILVAGWLVITVVKNGWRMASDAIGSAVVNQGTYYGQTGGMFYLPDDPYPKDLLKALIPNKYLKNAVPMTYDFFVSMDDKTIPVRSYIIGKVVKKDTSYALDPENNFKSINYNYCLIDSVFGGDEVSLCTESDSGLHVGDYVVVCGDIYRYMTEIDEEIAFSDKLYPKNDKNILYYRSFNPEDYGYIVTTN